MDSKKFKKYFNGGHIIEGFAILPSINYNWMKAYDPEKLPGNFVTCWELQFAWLFWYFTIGNVKVYLDKMK